MTSIVLKHVDRVRRGGLGVVFISHNVRYAVAVGDRYTALNRGQTPGTAVNCDITPEELQNMMAGGKELADSSDALGGAV